ncbi:MAG TPA: GNAT family N-acetyltransferase [Planctomycetota bacterium]|nr:GNAT family N-acetyltransferase [Planctomycetota bacterium]
MAVTLRKIRDEDREFLYRVYASTRAEELAVVPWGEAEKETFLRMQFDAQHRYYQEQYPDAAFDVIMRDGVAAGRLYVDRRKNEIELIDIALLPEHRRAGIGGALIGEILTEAGAAEKEVLIYVEQFNPAMRLYERLGFKQTGDFGVYRILRWRRTK